jgi:ankyrin repeat protein
LGYAAAHGVTDVLDAFLEKGVSPDIHGPTEDPPLVRAARAGDLTAVSHLLDAGAAVNATFPGGMTALMIAAATPSPDVFERLMAAHADVARRDRSGRSVLWFAAGAGDERMVDALLAAGVPIDGASPLFAAVQAGRADILERLLRKGVPVDTRNAVGDTALIAAATLGDTTVVRALLEGGAAVDAQNAAGNTPLIVATREGHIEVCKVLLHAGANAGLHNQDRADALDTARRRHLTEIAALLDSQ